MKRSTQNNDGLDIDRVAFFGRKYDGYVELFRLDEAVLGRGRILNCPGGASSFALEAARKNYDITTFDIPYDHGATNLFEKGNKAQDVTLIRHAYVRTANRNHGIGSTLLEFLLKEITTPVLIGTWADATWAIRFYEK